jgi:CubicO group peptidase (beta-lactamase class C family)
VDEGALTALLHEHAPRHSVPGATLGILRNGETTTACYGVADITTGEPVTPETRFSPGSLTKSMVATVTVRLTSTGRLSLDDPAALHVPELRTARWAGSATLRDLLANRARIPLRAGLEFGFANRAGTDAGALARLVADAAHEPPATAAWSYANLGWCILGRAIETATGMTWEEAMRRHLIDPAGMHATVFATGEAPVQRASGHAVSPDGPVPVEPLVSRAYGPAGTTALSTAPDLLRFAGLHLDDPALAPLRDAHSDTAIHGWLDRWCLGWAQFDWDGGPVWGWDGMITGERSVLRLMPRQRAAIVLLTNSGAGRALYRALFPELMDAAFGIDMPPLRLDPVPATPGDLAAFAGTYAWPDRRIDVTATRDGLRMTGEEIGAVAMPIDGRAFLVDPADPDGPTVTFGAFDPAGRPHVLYDMLWGLPRVGP